MCAGTPVALTGIEFDLLLILTQSPGAVCSREKLSTLVLGREYSPADRSLDNHISHVCAKLGPAVDGRRRIFAVRGAGYVYRFVGSAAKALSVVPAVS